MYLCASAASDSGWILLIAEGRPLATSAKHNSSSGRDMWASALSTTPLGLRLSQDGMNHNLDTQSLRAAIAPEDRVQIRCTLSPRFDQGITAFVDKRRPVFDAE